MGTNKQNLYFVAIIPPEPIYSEIKEFQQYMADKYRSKEALRRPSHVTLIPPFQTSEVQEEGIMNFITNFSSKQAPFELAIDGFGSFTVGVIYAAFVENERLKKMQKELILSFNKKFRVEGGKDTGRKFNPHMTVAFKDLSPIVFPNAKKEFEDKLYRRKWMLRDICLLKHNFKEWQIIKRTEFGTEDQEMTLGF
ncbi:MAG: 2'-5' RNA ligase family protein [Candidatus Kapaibacterium sp.]